MDTCKPCKPTAAKRSLPTRQQYDERRQKHREQLLRSVDPTEGLFSALSAIDTFSHEVANIKKMNTVEDIADNILLLPLDTNFDKTIGPFMKVLRKYGHAHVADVFITGSNDLLKDETYQLLSDKLADLCMYLDPECSIVDSLRSAGVFAERDEDRVRAQSTTDDKARQIIKIISRKSNKSYQQFINILTQRDQGHIVYILTGRGSPPISKKNLKIICKQRKSLIQYM